MVDNLTIADYLDMQAPDQNNYVRLKTHLFIVPDPAPILRIEQGIMAFKDLSSLGYLATVSKTEIPIQASGYTNCVPSDIGKQVKDDGDIIPNVVLAGYDNNGSPPYYTKKWWLSGSTSVASGSAMTIVDGPGAGTSSGNSSVYGGGAIKIGHGLTGETDPPKISLMDSSQGYDNLYIRKSDGTTPAHLNLGSLYAQDVYAKGSSSSGNGAHLWADTPGHFFLATHNATSPAWRIGYGNGSGGLDTDQPNILSDGQVLTFANFTSIRTAAIYGENGSSNVALHGTADYATSAGSASSATYATSAGSASSASAIPVLSSDPSSPATGSIWLKT